MLIKEPKLGVVVVVSSNVKQMAPGTGLKSTVSGRGPHVFLFFGFSGCDGC